MDKDDKLQYGNDLVLGCMLPELIKELGADFIETKHFDEFRNVLEYQLTQVFDFIQQNESLIFNIESTTKEIRRNFILLICEQTAPCTLYQTKNEILLKQLNILIDKHFRKLFNEDNNLESLIFNYYKEKLKSNLWRKQLGAVHGFIQFLDLRYRNTNNEIPSNVITFILSVGLLFNEFFDPTYKELSFKCFVVLLKNSKEDGITNLNIHDVIYKTLSLDVFKEFSSDGTKDLWTCLLKCVDIEGVEDYSKWSKVDDLIEVAFKRIALAPNNDIRRILFLNISKLCASSSYNKDDIMMQIEKFQNNILVEDVNRLHKMCEKIHSPPAYRWAKKILKLFISESNCLLHNSESSQFLLKAMHATYIVCISPISINVVALYLIQFLDKFIPVLMEIVRINEKESQTIQIVKGILNTFLHHLRNWKNRNEELHSLENAINNLLKNDIFAN